MSTLKAFLNTKEKLDNPIYGAIIYHSYLTQEIEVKETEFLPRKGQTLSGYGKALPTNYMVKIDGSWNRVKCVCFSNSCTLYVGKIYSECATITIEKD